jgi:hypothetical protein
MSSTPSVKNETIRIQNLTDSFGNGKLMVPDFQRSYVWKPIQATSLLDSLLKGFPIASLVVWEPPPSAQVRSRNPNLGPRSACRWIVDGQQRTTTIWRIRENLDFKSATTPESPDRFKYKMHFDPSEAIFHVGKKRRGSLLVSEIWNKDAYNELRRQMYEENRPQHEIENIERVHKILDVELPLILLQSHSEDAVVSIFININSKGTKTKGVDQVSANIASKHTGFVQDHLLPFMSFLETKGFSKISTNLAFRACAGIASIKFRGGKSLSERGVLDLENHELIESWKAMRSATEAVIELVKSEFSVSDMKILGSGYLLVPPIVLLACHKRLNAKAIAAWMVVAAMKSRYSASSETRLDEDLRNCRDPKKALPALLKSLGLNTRSACIIEPDLFNGAINDNNLQFVTYVACINKSALDLFTYQNIAGTSTIHRHHILPRARFENRADADRMSNIAFVNKKTNEDISDRDPSEYLLEVARRNKTVLDSQCIPTNRRLWNMEAAHDFMDARQVLLAQSLSSYLTKSLALPLSRG